MEALLKIMAFLVNDLIEPRDVLPSEKAKLAHRAYRILRFAGRTSPFCLSAGHAHLLDSPDERSI